MATAPKAGTSLGTPGAAVLIGALALWFVYVGVRDVPVLEGLRQLLRGEQPVPGRAHEAFKTVPTSSTQGFARSSGGAPGDTGIDRLVGNAALAYPRLKALFPSLTFGGWRSTGSVPNSDHPRGLALDIMHPTSLQAAQIIQAFLPMPGAKYWIWDRRIASADQGWRPRPYGGPNPHTDHVHLSFR